MMSQQRGSIDAEVRSLLAKCAAAWKSRDDATMLHSRWQLMQLVLENPLSRDTHGLLVSQLPFRDEDIPPYVHRLLFDHSNAGLSLVADLLLRTDSEDSDPIAVDSVIRQLAGLPAFIYTELLPNWWGTDPRFLLQKDQLAALPPLNELLIAEQARKLLDYLEQGSDGESSWTFRSRDDGPLGTNAAGLIALAYRIPPFEHVPRKYGRWLALGHWAFPASRLGVNLFNQLLTPAQTEDVREAMKWAPETHGQHWRRMFSDY